MIRKIFRQMLAAQILSAMTVMLCMLVDSIMIGRFLGVDSMSAYGLANPVLLVFAAYGTMLSAGIQVMCGKTMGAGDREGTDACFSASAVMALSVALTGMVLVLLFLTPLATLLGAGKPGADPVFNLTKDYLRGFIIGAPAFITAQIMVPFMQISGNRTRLALAVVLMTLSDVAFDLLDLAILHIQEDAAGCVASRRGIMVGAGYGVAVFFPLPFALVVGLAVHAVQKLLINAHKHSSPVRNPITDGKALRPLWRIA